MRKLILHIGTHKTGTTSIQTALADAREWLGARGLCYPDGGPVYKSRVPHHKWSHGLTGTDPAQADASKAYIDYARSLGRADDTLILSAEPIYRHADGYDRFDFSIIDDYWERRGRYVHNVAAALDSFDVRVVVWLRERDSFARSLFAEVSKKGKWQGPFDEFLQSFAVWFEYERQLQLFRDAFSQIDVYSYEVASESGLVPYFFEQIGFPAPPGSEDIWTRRSDYGALSSMESPKTP
jgi:hypothetical protein